MTKRDSDAGSSPDAPDEGLPEGYTSRRERRIAAAQPVVTEKLPVIALFTLAAAGFITMMAEMLPVGLNNEIAQDLGLTESQAGAMLGVFALGTAGAAVPVAAMTRTQPRKSLLLVLMGVFLATTAVTGYSDQFPVIMAARLIAGMSAGVMWAMLAGYAVSLSPADKQGKGMSIAMVGTPLALAFGVPAGTAIGNAFSWRGAFWFMAGVIAVLMLVMMIVLQKVPGEQRRARKSVTEVLLMPGMRTVAISTLLFATGHMVAYAFIQAILGLSGQDQNVAPYQLAFGAAAAAGLFFIGANVDKKLRSLIWQSCLLLAVALIIIAVVVKNPLAMYGAMVVWGLSFGGTPTLLQTGSALNSGSARDVGQAMIVMAWNGAIALGYAIGGWVLEAEGLGAGYLMWVGAAIAVAALALTFINGSAFTSAAARTRLSTAEESKAAPKSQESQTVVKAPSPEPVAPQAIPTATPQTATAGISVAAPVAGRPQLSANGVAASAAAGVPVAPMPANQGVAPPAPPGFYNQNSPNLTTDPYLLNDPAVQAVPAHTDQQPITPRPAFHTDQQPQVSPVTGPTPMVNPATSPTTMPMAHPAAHQQPGAGHQTAPGQPGASNVPAIAGHPPASRYPAQQGPGTGQIPQVPGGHSQQPPPFAGQHTVEQQVAHLQNPATGQVPAVNSTQPLPGQAQVNPADFIDLRGPHPTSGGTPQVSPATPSSTPTPPGGSPFPPLGNYPGAHHQSAGQAPTASPNTEYPVVADPNPQTGNNGVWGNVAGGPGISPPTVTTPHVSGSMAPGGQHGNQPGPPSQELTQTGGSNFGVSDRAFDPNTPRDEQSEHRFSAAAAEASYFQTPPASYPAPAPPATQPLNGGAGHHPATPTSLGGVPTPPIVFGSPNPGGASFGPPGQLPPGADDPTTAHFLPTGSFPGAPAAAAGQQQYTNGSVRDSLSTGMLLMLEETLSRRVVGQDDAIKTIAGALRRFRLDAEKGTRPLGSFLMVGPPGVGRTELIEALAEALYTNSRAVVRVQLGQMNGQSLRTHLVGSVDRPGVLSEHLGSRGGAVIVLDNPEHGPYDTTEVLTEMLGQGRVSHPGGSGLDITNCVVALTRTYNSLSWLDTNPRAVENKEDILRSLSHHVGNHVAHKLDDVVQLLPLSPPSLCRMAVLQIERLVVDVAGFGKSVDVTPAAQELIVRRCVQSNAGVQQLVEIVRRDVFDQLQQSLSSSHSNMPGAVTVDAMPGQDRLIVRHQAGPSSSTF